MSYDEAVNSTLAVLREIGFETNAERSAEVPPWRFAFGWGIRFLPPLNVPHDPSYTLEMQIMAPDDTVTRFILPPHILMEQLDRLFGQLGIHIGNELRIKRLTALIS